MLLPLLLLPACHSLPVVPRSLVSVHFSLPNRLASIWLPHTLRLGVGELQLNEITVHKVSCLRNRWQARAEPSEEPGLAMGTVLARWAQPP